MLLGIRAIMDQAVMKVASCVHPVNAHPTIRGVPSVSTRVGAYLTDAGGGGLVQASFVRRSLSATTQDYGATLAAAAARGNCHTGQRVPSTQRIVVDDLIGHPTSSVRG